MERLVEQEMVVRLVIVGDVFFCRYVNMTETQILVSSRIKLCHIFAHVER